jgi:hypothetical protein
MPSVIGTDPSSGVNVAANYLKTQPSTRFGTRDLAVVVITVYDYTLGDGPSASDSDFSRAIRAIQTIGEIYAVGAPQNNGSDSSFTVLLSAETLGDVDFVNSNNDNNNATNIQTVLNTLFNTSIDVGFTYMLGNGYN